MYFMFAYRSRRSAPRVQLNCRRGGRCIGSRGSAGLRASAKVAALFAAADALVRPQSLPERIPTPRLVGQRGAEEPLAPTPTISM
jgi:hypothetical protein